MKDKAVDEAFDGLGETWDFWQRAFSRDSIDDEGMPLRGIVHYGDDYDNAFWDGRRMVFGDGDGELFTRFTDVARRDRPRARRTASSRTRPGSSTRASPAR